ncbi:hypothetical protein [uncultured Algimonas sp.]|uniref:hypothetical protein n=1 Tax=uncultured Algimonas sp. TaxID=1547920 RepID=UPI002639C388|nr:hypothetical protein [uncultured Algimonas sp.]
MTVRVLTTMFFAASLITGCGASIDVKDNVLAHETPVIPELAVSLLPDGETVRVDYRAAQPVSRIDFRRVAGPARSEDWETPDGFALIHDSDAGTDVLSRVDGKPFSDVRLVVPAVYRNLPKDYAPFSPFSDAGLLIHSGRFQACPNTCPEDDTGWSQHMSLIVPDGSHAIVDGEVVHAEVANWVDRQDGQMVYLGKAVPVETEQVIGVIDPALPPSVSVPLSRLLPQLITAYSARFGALPVKPQLFVSIEPPPMLPEGQISFSVQGGTLPDQIFMHLMGNFWALPVEEWGEDHKRFLPVFFAHEAAHLYQRVDGVEREPDDSWIHEGGADALALVVLRDLGELSDAGLMAETDTRLKSCAEGLADMPLHRAVEEGRFDLHYFCGMAVMLSAVAEGADLYAVWNAYLSKLQDGKPYGGDTLRSVFGDFGAEQAEKLSERINADAERPDYIELQPLVDEWWKQAGRPSPARDTLSDK